MDHVVSSPMSSTNGNKRIVCFSSVEKGDTSRRDGADGKSWPGVSIAVGNGSTWK